MQKFIITSTQPNAGKTSLIVGLAKVLNKKFGYMKPLGDRLLYRKKELWDYDAALVTNIFDLPHNPTHISLGFDHSKLKYMYDRAATKEKIEEAVQTIGRDQDLLFIEDSKSFTYGISVHLDAISLAEFTQGNLIFVVYGDEDAIFDQITFLKKHINLSQVNLSGIIINKLQDGENFETTYLPEVTGMGFKVLGMLPQEDRLTHYALDYLADYLFAKVVTGEGGLQNVVQNVFVGAASVNEALRNPVVKKENNLAITSGDRTDMIMAALESNVVGIILTNNILPPANVISQASQRNVPLLLVPADTYQTARKIDQLQPLLTKDDTTKIELLAEMVQEHVAVNEIIK